MSFCNEENNYEINIIYIPKSLNDPGFEDEVYDPHWGWIRIFGETFVEKNRNNCRILYKDKEYELKEYIEEIDSSYNHKDDIFLALRIINSIIDISSIFSDCTTLSFFPW